MGTIARPSDRSSPPRTRSETICGSKVPLRCDPVRFVKIRLLPRVAKSALRDTDARRTQKNCESHLATRIIPGSMRRARSLPSTQKPLPALIIRKKQNRWWRKTSTESRFTPTAPMRESRLQTRSTAAPARASSYFVKKHIVHRTTTNSKMSFHRFS